MAQLLCRETLQEVACSDLGSIPDQAKINNINYHYYQFSQRIIHFKYQNGLKALHKCFLGAMSVAMQSNYTE